MRSTRRLGKRTNRRPSRKVGKARKAKLTRRYRGGVHYTKEELNHLKTEIKELMNDSSFLQEAGLEDLSNYLDDQSRSDVDKLFEIYAHKILDCSTENITSKADVKSHVQQYLTRFYNGHVNNNNTLTFAKELKRLNDGKDIKYDCVNEFSENDDLKFVPGQSRPQRSPLNRTRKSNTKPRIKIKVREKGLPAGWNSEIDPKSNVPYYWHDSDPSNTTTWIHPTNKSPHKSPGKKSSEKNKSPTHKSPSAAASKRKSPSIPEAEPLVEVEAPAAAAAAAAPAATLPSNPSFLAQIGQPPKLRRKSFKQKSPPKLSAQELVLLGIRNNGMKNLRPTNRQGSPPSTPPEKKDTKSLPPVNRLPIAAIPVGPLGFLSNNPLLSKFGTRSKKEESSEWSSEKPVVTAAAAAPPQKTKPPIAPKPKNLKK
jgi:hypothetical protein